MPFAFLFLFFILKVPYLVKITSYYRDSNRSKNKIDLTLNQSRTIFQLEGLRTWNNNCKVFLDGGLRNLEQ